MSPSSRGRGLKFRYKHNNTEKYQVALFTRAWIEIIPRVHRLIGVIVALFTRAWIEISRSFETFVLFAVALFTRAWIEIICVRIGDKVKAGRPLHEGVD